MITEEMLREIKTPAYIFDIDALRSRIAMIRSQLGEKIRLVYAIKANPFIIKELIPLVDAFEVCSPGEERICEKAGIPGHMLVLSGVNKERENFSQIMDRYGDAPVYTAESQIQMDMLQAVAASKGLTLQVLPRLCGGSQFGMDESVLREIAANADRYPNLHIRGIHFFTGTQKKDRRIEKEIARMDALLGELTVYGQPLRELEYGPGLAVSYYPEAEGDESAQTAGTDPGEQQEEASLALACEAISRMHFTGQVTLEMGRYIAACCGTYVTKVMDLKHNDGTNYCIVDGGIHQVNYYGQNMAMKIPKIRHLKSGSGTASFAAGKQAWTVCGSLCTTADVLVREWGSHDLGVHDILAFEKTGAYSVTEGVSLFLSRDLPRVYLAKGNGLKLVRDKIKTEDFNYGTSD